MIIKLTKSLFVLTYIVILVFFLPEIALALPEQINTRANFIVAHTTTSYSEIELTPLQRQRLQAVRQRRNREIQAVLNSSQRAQLAQELHRGNNLNQGLEKLNLKPEQQELIKAILKFTNLKIKFIFPKNPPAI
ncbi:hypothetical protein NIES2100_69150 [Calothrix sp. NIES-2100]|uniref:hypothetical protein n=1 Tax=Calothrix sp. NIES-2100 TaxID=1954172 RepID=UPI000B60688D|nr:hypothetical protein NIES2100_69150 [Calothrix sp. NIES-2100]